MFNPPKLHKHDWFMTMVTTLIESSVKGGSGGDHGDGDDDDHGWSGLYGPNGTFDGGGGGDGDGGPFNFTVKRALDAIFENQLNVDKVLVLYLEVAIVVAYGVLFVIGLVSNGLVCFVVFRQCGKKNVPSQGPSPRNLYIVNLAFADIIMCVVCMPFTLWALMSRRWTWGLIMCKTVPAAQGANITVSACTITAIALDRYFTIVRNPRGSVFRCSVAKTLVLIWMVSFAAMVPLLLYQNVEEVHVGPIRLYEACVEKWPNHMAQQTFTVGLAVAQFVLPFTTISLIHLKISSYLTVHLKHPAVPSKEINCRRVRRELSRNKRTMWILSSIAVVFAISWLPLTVFTLLVEFQPHLIDSTDALYKAFAVVHMMAMSTTCTNPLLYGWLNTNFRRDISGICRQMWYCCGDQKPPPRRRRYPSVATDYRGPNDRRLGLGSEAAGGCGGGGGGGGGFGGGGGSRRHHMHHDPETTGMSMVVKSDRRFSTSYLTTLTTVTSRSQPGSSMGRVENV
ncbi:neuropeptide Y receptor type 2-like [Metopolophium dirhodum]|uniref:neuropeptide Y receptor type 2-like n=1 Tax=Metopolophium dirhodum TaxID=44670 RepID=UPI00299057B0|nr:neuropeptide Y receptor type 2-like [Metopolophium dirhodum]